MINHLIKSALMSKQKNPRFAYLAPTFKQAKSIAWDYMKQFTDKIPHTKLELTYPMVLGLLYLDQIHQMDCVVSILMAA